MRCAPVRMSERFTVRLDDEATEWVEAEADARDRSKAWIIQEAVDAARGTASVFTGAERTDAVRTGADLTERLDELEERLAALEADRPAEPVATDAADGGAAGTTDSAADEAPTRGPPEPTNGATSRPAAREPPGVDEAPSGPVLEELLAGWSPGRDREEREQRRTLGRQVLEWLQETEGYVSAADVKDALYPGLAYADESADTWWRKVARPPVQAAVDAGLAEYREGYHDYRWLGEPDDRDDVDGAGVGDARDDGTYDPTEEF